MKPEILLWRNQLVWTEGHGTKMIENSKTNQWTVHVQTLPTLISFAHKMIVDELTYARFQQWTDEALIPAAYMNDWVFPQLFFFITCVTICSCLFLVASWRFLWLYNNNQCDSLFSKSCCQCNFLWYPCLPVP